MKKVYYQMTLCLQSPLRIGNGKNEESDSDILLDGRGVPFIPGSSLAGIIRHRSEEIHKDSESLKRLFGYIKKSGETDESVEAVTSSLIIGDATLVNSEQPKNVKVGLRDGIRLGEWGTVVGNSKYDFQIAETSEEFKAVIEWTGDDNQYKEEIEKILEPIFQHYIERGFTVGAKTSRGYGRCSVKFSKREFVLPKELESWLAFHPYRENAFDKKNSLLSGKADDKEIIVELSGKADDRESIVEISFKMVGAFSVRVNTAKIEITEEGVVPDAVPMENYEGSPVIPGTSWAGAFRHHMHALLRDVGVAEKSEEMKDLDRFYGIEGKGSIGKSRLSFSETAISNAKRYAFSRNALDRFTAIPRTGALYTEVLCIGGEGKLIISFREEDMKEPYRSLLAACIVDLHHGLLAVGGETAVGRGMLKISGLEYNGKDKMAFINHLKDESVTLDWFK